MGYTSRTIDVRFQEHLHDSVTNQAKSERIAELQALGLTPIVEEIERGYGTLTQVLEREAYWIHYYLSEGVQLTNSYVGAEEMKRQTVYIPKPLATWLKAHAAVTDDDISGIITRLVEQYRDEVEGKNRL